ncbi:UDP-N-acetylmuramoyl-tripeptide--D-alanyl-D-alanine ligase [Paenactinomyces guangxiensis]|uniref:UDP-N-acetylmuramoyl-tripeptide--D-alanyl-D-alanine ligase n=1 Tax=Paenactinomyces guangxiensis TaxID=1490290 RepID=A0A7W1WR74_9BACL|nr:UDP-N-acetylmuramoyl-tripeptide--D-alanyl-D-alanine ligase [Paenactinomyces guangxiensis]MBA4494473.1 UDP-N-acetylmuramoyl-tripeptide--D-alanyl-D-alanine ligase [Paenactinomyces guangxiensis]MBH8591472.1 UDP-N-acetylmuramoyl-tripeptide--D-alanyl-D-alanine ligase [Paenactinomyces guangxiensis]
MFPINLGQLSRIIGGQLVRGNANTPISHPIYQSIRYLGPGKVFFLKTKYTNKFSPEELRARKSAGIIATPALAKLVPPHHPLILVPDIDTALWKLAAWQRSQSKALVIGVTGSQGKTTTKEMLASILKQKYITYKSPSNHNIATYIPNHLFHLNGRHQVAVLEMGMSSLGNIRKQCFYARPKIGIVTNVGEAHVGKLGNTLKNVVKAKQEIVDGIDSHGFLILNADDKGSRQLSLRKFHGKVNTVGIKNKATYQAANIRFTRNGMHFTVNGVPYHIKTWGKHQIYNALAAIAAARLLKVPTRLIQQGLAGYHAPSMRLQKLYGIKKYLLINDAYNANPSSMIAGLRVLKRLSKKRKSVAVLGDMSELGSHSTGGHARVGKVVSKIKPTYLITIGPQAAIIARTADLHGMPKTRIRPFPNQSAALTFIRSAIPAGSILYFKASRKTRLEWLVKQLKDKR